MQAPPEYLDAFLEASYSKVSTFQGPDFVHSLSALAARRYDAPNRPVNFSHWFEKYCAALSRR